MSQRSGGARPGGPAAPGINLRGAVDLSGLGQRPAAGQAARPSGGPGTGGPSADAAAVVVDVTEETFPQLVQQSMTVPVVVDLWATWCQPCTQLSPVLERLAVEYGGQVLLAKVDVDANPQIAQAFQVQSIPSVVAILKGQPVPLFQGAYPEEQVRQYFDELLRVAQANGVTGRLDVGVVDAEEPAEPPLPPLHQEAYDAIERDDLDAAADAYRRALSESPADAEAAAGLAQVALLQRTRTADLQAARAAAAADPADLDAQLLVADLDVLGGHVEDAFARLVGVVRATSGEDRERVRARLVELFTVVGTDDPRVATARRALASALF